MSVAVRLKCPILHVDDDADDHFFFKHAARRTDTPFHIQPFFFGDPAIAYLRQEAPFDDLAVYPPPVLILCDCNPRSTGGRDLVAAIRALGPFANLPIIMFSGSERADCVGRCYAAGADHFLRKPFDSTRLDIIVQTLYACATSVPRSFDALTGLEEYQPRPL
jgi:CheY-like chemotaxis protein